MNELILPSGKVSRDWIEREYMAGVKAAQELSQKVSKNQIEAKLSTLSSSTAGLNLLGKEMRSPLLREMLYESRARSLAEVYKLSQGESAEFWSDIAVGASAIGVDGLPAQVEVKSDYVRVDTRMFATNPYCRWNQSNLTKFDILNAVQQRAKASMMLQEAAAWFRLIRWSSGLRSGQGTTAGLEGYSAADQNAPGSVATSTPGRISLDQLSLGIAKFGARLIDGPKKLWINPQRVHDLNMFNFGAGNGGNGFFAPETTEMIMKKGFVGNILGAEVVQDIVVPVLDSGVTTDSKAGTGSEDVMGYLLGPAEYVGLMVIRTDLSVETLKDATRLADVFCAWADLGMYSRWQKAVQRLTND